MRCLVTESNKFFNEMNEVRIFFHGVRKKFPRCENFLFKNSVIESNCQSIEIFLI